MARHMRLSNSVNGAQGTRVTQHTDRKGFAARTDARRSELRTVQFSLVAAM